MSYAGEYDSQLAEAFDDEEWSENGEGGGAAQARALPAQEHWPAAASQPGTEALRAAAAAAVAGARPSGARLVVVADEDAEELYGEENEHEGGLEYF